MRQPVIALWLYAEYLEAGAGQLPRTGAEDHQGDRRRQQPLQFAVRPVEVRLRRGSPGGGGGPSLRTHRKPRQHRRRARKGEGHRAARPHQETHCFRRTPCARRMIGNVVSNAIKYSHPGTKILLTPARATARCGSRCGIRIGIPASKIKNVFDEFFRADGGNQARAGRHGHRPVPCGPAGCRAQYAADDGFGRGARDAPAATRSRRPAARPAPCRDGYDRPAATPSPRYSRGS